MAHDEDLAERIRTLLDAQPAITEKRMFGGPAFLLEGHIVIAVSSQGGLMARVEPGEAEALRAQPHVGPMVMRGKELDGWVRVEAAGVEADEQLSAWVDRGLDVARAL